MPQPVRPNCNTEHYRKMDTQIGKPTVLNKSYDLKLYCIVCNECNTLVPFGRDEYFLNNIHP